MGNIPDWVSSWSLGGKLSLIWFVIISGLIVYFSHRLVQNLTIISNKTNLNDSFLGGAFIAVITSMPELITEITQAYMGHPEIGIADDVGSNAFAIFLIGIASVILVRKMFLNKMQKFTKISLWMSSFAMLLFSIFLLINRDFGFGQKGIFFIGLIPLLFFIYWIISLIITYKKGDSDSIIDNPNNILKISIKKAIFNFIFYGICLIVMAVFLNWIVTSIQQGYNLNNNVAGGFFLAISTSLPEIIVFILMLRKGFLAGAVLALIGSQIFNLGISFFGDITYNQEATFNLLNVKKVWPLSILATMMLILLSFQATFFKFFIKKRYYLIIPSIVICSYLVGWTLIALY